MEPRKSITAVIITLNGERLLGRCLDSLSFCDSLLVVDSFSNDSTESIARAHGAVFLQNTWPGNARQIRFGVDWLERNAPTEWVLFFDCDEICTPELAASIQRAVAVPGKAVAFSMSRRTWYYDRFLLHGGSYPDRLFRLFRPEAIHIEESGAHQHFVPNGPSGELTGDMLHYTYSSFRNQLDKLNDYAQRGAQDQEARGQKGGVATALVHGLWRFVDMYLVRRGFLDGKAGFLMAVHTTFYTFLKYIRIHEGTWGAPYDESGEENVHLSRGNFPHKYAPILADNATNKVSDQASGSPVGTEKDGADSIAESTLAKFPLRNGNKSPTQTDVDLP